MYNKALLYLPVLTLAFLISCQEHTSKEEASIPPNPYTKIQDSLAIQILQKAMAAAGGLDRWNSQTSISFSKSFKLLYEDGSVEQEVDQIHTYIYQPDYKVEINWKNENNKHQIVFAEEAYQKFVNGELDTTADKQNMENSILSSTFVANLPFKIVMDEGADITYEGKDTLESGQIVECIQVKYFPDQFSNHSSEDIWNLYFDQNTYHLIAYLVKHADHHSYVVNTKDTIIDGFYFVKDRKSYRVTPERELLYLRAVYHYDDYKIEF